ncbi:MAG: hypothetical protein ACOCUO_03250 [archaeon]
MQSATAAIDNAMEQLELHVGARDRAAEKYKKDVSAQPTRVHAFAAGAFNTLAVAAVTLMVVVFVIGMIDESMDMDSESEFHSSYETVTGTTGDALNLAAVALIVLVASVILYYVGNFGGNGRRLSR